MNKWAYALLLLLTLPTARAEDEILFIVNSENPAETITANDISDFYFKKRREWPSGETVRFIDRASGSGLRKIFLSLFIRKTAQDVDLFWISQKLQSGNSAPLQEASDTTTIHFVSIFKGALGYVSPKADLESSNVKLIKVVREEK